MLTFLGVCVPGCVCLAYPVISYLHSTVSKSPDRGDVRSRGLFWVTVPNGWEEVVSVRSSLQLCVMARCGQIKK